MDPKTKKRLLTFSTERQIYILLFAVMFIVTEIGRFTYRPYIYRNDIFDFWIADTIGNFTGTMTIIFFELAGINPELKFGRLMVALIPVGLIIYEFVQYFLPGTNTCDWRDIVATIIAGLLSWLIYETIHKNYYQEESLS